MNKAVAGNMPGKIMLLESLKKKRGFVIDLSSALLILLFLYTGLSKLMDYTTFRIMMAQSPLIGRSANFLATALPVSEIIISILLLIPKTKKIGLLLSLLLMMIFTGYLTYMIYFTPQLPCSCGGVISQMSWKQHLLFNIFFTLIAFVGFMLERSRLKGSNIN